MNIEEANGVKRCGVFYDDNTIKGKQHKARLIR